MKNQLKKSLSFIMAVIMLMSCWVWVAPTEAEAAAPSSYDVKIDFNVSDQINGGRAHADIYYIPNNGTGSVTGPITWEMDKLESTTGEYSMTYSNVPGWPCQIYIHIGDHGMKQAKIQMKNIYINGSLVHEGSYTLEAGWWGSDSRDFIPNTKGSATADGTSGTVSGNTEGKWNWPRPKLNEATAVLSPENVTLTKLGTTTEQKSTITVSGLKDQYGVNWTASANVTFGLRVDEGKTLGSHATITDNGSNATVAVKPSFQTLYPNASNGKLYVDWAVNTNAKEGTIPLTVNFPTYDTTFDANGGKIGPNENAASDTIKITGKKYGEVIGNSPVYRSKAGFEFDGFYSVKNDDATGLTASFSGTKFKDSETPIDTVGDSTWYAAWKATPITATFVTADNQLIGTVDGRYNNSYTAANMYNGDAGLNAAVKASHKAGKVKFNSNNEPIYKDGSTTYTFAGWKIIEAYDAGVVDGNEDTVLKGDVKFQAVYKKADAATYTVTFEDGAGNTAASKSGYKYRDAVTGVPANATKATDDRYSYEFIGWAKKLANVNYFAVDANDCDADGVKIAYTSKDAAEFIVKGNATYVPVFRMTPREYSVTFNYKVDGGNTETKTVGGYNWDDTPEMPEIKDNYTAGGFRYTIDGWKVGTDNAKKQLDDIKVNGDLVLTATYGAGIGAEYIINFYGKAEDGETDVLLNSGKYTHNSTVTVPEAAQTIDTEDSLYTFAGWSPSVNTTAAADADYYATYTKKDYADLHFYNYDGTLIYELDGKENSFFAGETTIPAYENIVDGVNVLPVKEEDPVGTYKFIGWKDGSGNDVVPGTDKFDGDTYLTAQFETVYKNYTVKFLNDDGSVLSEKTYHYATEIEIPANPAKAADEEYIYDFRAWTPDVSEVCYGDATYTATYRRTPQYYKVTWLKDNKTVLTESNYKYNQTIQQAVADAPVSYPDATEGKYWAFKHWVQCDASGKDILVDGKQVIFIRGQKMPAEALFFYPVFEEVDNILTVNFYKEDGTSYIGTAKVPYGGTLADYGEAFKEKAPKAPDSTYHYIINNWVNVDGGADVTTVTADVNVKASYTPVAHSKQLYEVIAEPTCNVPGYANYKCAADECTLIDYNVAIAPIADEAAPTGQVYVGSDKWTLKNYTDGINYTDVKYVGPKTNIIVNAQDIGTRSMPWNVEGALSRGVGTIDYYVSEMKVNNPADLAENDWTNVYNYEQFRQEALESVLEANNITLLEYNGYNHGTAEDKMKKASIDREVDALLSVYNANATGVLSNLNLANGKSYIIYIRVSDRAGNGEVNSCYFSTGMICYGTTVPEIAVSGDGYGTKFCADATVTVTDDTDGLKVYLDGEEVTLTDGALFCEEKGLHTVTVINKFGNKATRTFEIKGSHNYRNYTIAATCETAGSTYDLCTLCGAKANEKVLPARGHSYTDNYIDKAPTCVVDGYRTYVCDNNCGEKLVTVPDELKATGEHTYAKVKDENGEDTAEDAWVIDKEATCSVAGSKHKDCIKCGLAEARVTEEIPVDTVNGHKFYREKVTTEPTCTAQGEKTQTCRYCGYVKHIEYIDALGHSAEDYADDAEEYRIITAATCETKGSKIRVCSRCGVDIGEPVKDAQGKVTGFDNKAVEIPALGHAWKAVNDPYKGSVDANGNVIPDSSSNVWYQDYECKNDATHKKSEITEHEEKIAATVTFDYAGGKVVVTPAEGVEGEDGYKPAVIATNKTVSSFVGETITVAQVGKEPSKDANATYKYTFSHWEDKDGNEVKFPIEVKGDATYTAVYTEKYVNYTITYYKEVEKKLADGTVTIELQEYKKTGYLHNGEKVTLADGPARASDAIYDYNFDGWKVKSSNPEVVYNKELTIDGANVNLVARYAFAKKSYAVTYAYSWENQIHTYTVPAGDSAPDVKYDFGEAVKAPDTKYHYTFKEWNKKDQLASVQSNIYTTPEFDKELHDCVLDAENSVAATCTEKAINTYKCKYCDYSYVSYENARGHNFGGTPTYNAETGKNIVSCQNDGCNETQEDTRTFTVKFYVKDDVTQAFKLIKTISYIPWGSKIETIKLPADPTKDSTATTDYTFKGWIIKGSNATTGVDFATLEIRQDYEFVAIFTESIRKYTVTFAYNASNVIETYKDVPAGSTITYSGKTPVKAYDDNYHYTFSGWSGSTANIQGDVYVTAKFDKIKHTYTETTLNEATCQNGKGIRYICTCGHYYDRTGKPLEHNWELVEHKEPTALQAGYNKYKCASCGTTKSDSIPYKDDKISVQVSVTHNGAAKSGIQVEVIENSASAVPVTATTNSAGVANLSVTKGKTYSCYVTVNGEKIQVSLAESNGVLYGSYSYTDKGDCTCACHRDNFWGSIFRFFHKIIKLFTGEFKCCGNPDPMYG